MDLRLSGRTAVVTGASKGIGLAVTRTLLDEGARVVAASRTPGTDLEALAGPALLHVPVDLMDAAAPAQVVERAVEVFGGLDILVNNAGGPPPGVTLPRFGFLGLTDDDWRAMFEFNLFSAVRTTRSAIPHMVAGGGGAIVNISSGQARRPGPINVDYGAAKAGMNNLTKALAEEYGPQGIRVNCISAGPVRTHWWTKEGGAADVLSTQSGATREAVIDKVAPEAMALSTGRLADPQEVADTVALLVSPLSASTTGADFVVDSGHLKEI